MGHRHGEGAGDFSRVVPPQAIGQDHDSRIRVGQDAVFILQARSAPVGEG